MKDRFETAATPLKRDIRPRTASGGMLLAEPRATPTTVAVAGFGTVGRVVARRIQESLPEFMLTAVSGRDLGKARRAVETLITSVPVLPPEALGDVAEVIVECVPTQAFSQVVRPAIARGRTVVTISAAALLDNLDLVDECRKTNGRIVLATGALLGLDAVRAASFGAIQDVRMITRKPPKSLRTAKSVIENGIDLDALQGPLKIFEGTARDGAQAFPANVNVAAALALAGIGPDRTQLEIWADPALERNTHRIIVEADSARFEMLIENVPTDENPGTGKITALSILAALQSLSAPLRIGS